MGLVQLGTQQPDCGMHEVSLDAAVSAGQPLVLLFATPAYCQTAVCGPAVNTLDQVRQSRDWGDVAFIHVEIFRDAGPTAIRRITRYWRPLCGWHPSKVWVV
jgi:hypothetical protein